MANLSDSFPAAAGSNILEAISGTCDGRAIEVMSGTYTLGNVTAYQNLSTSYVDVTGSSIAYTPPSDANHVLYKFDFEWDSIGSSGISHFKLIIDGTEVVPAYKCISSNYSGNHGHHHAHHMESMFYNFDLAASSDDAANGKFASWTTAKTIKVQAREYDSATYQAAVHHNAYYSTFGTSQYTKPSLTVKAYS
jgi:hypothetical protein|tara:strand:+ start:116 stop:694 length:579 start_codon:yes stop_codon:yes gene_type:complete